MDLKDMKIFLKIAEYENLTRASADLHIAQPHLTRRLKELENELGVCLFVRNKRRLHITEEGLYLKQQCREMLALNQKTTEHLKEMKSGLAGRLDIGSIESASVSYLPDQLLAFHQKYPEVRYHLWAGNSDDVLDRLQKGLVDLALIRSAFDPRQYDFLKIREEEWIALLSSKNPLAGKEGELTLRELANEPLIIPSARAHEITSDWFGSQGLSPRIICEISPLMNAIVMTEKNLGTAILPDDAPDYFADHSLVKKRIKEKKATTLCLIWEKERKLTSVASKFVSFIKSTSEPIT